MQAQANLNRCASANNEKKDAHHGTYMKFASSRFAALIELPACRQAGAHLWRRIRTTLLRETLCDTRNGIKVCLAYQNLRSH